MVSMQEGVRSPATRAFFADAPVLQRVCWGGKSRGSATANAASSHANRQPKTDTGRGKHSCQPVST